MQKQAQVAGQHGQPPSPLVRAGFQPLRKNLAGWQKAWHNESDANLRYQIISHISRLVQKRGSENKIAQTAYDVELPLYLDAVSKEEYGDLSTLEQRICSLFIRLRNNPNSAQNGAQLGSVLSNTAMVPTPGCSNSTTLPLGRNTDFSTSVTGRSLSKKDGSRFSLNTGGTMAASVHDINSVGPTAGFSDNLFASAIEQAPSSSLCGSYPEKNAQLISGIGMARPGSQMIPTPGLNVRSPPAKLVFHNASELSSSSAGLSFHNASDTSINNLKQQQLTKGSGCQIFGGMSAQYNGMFGSNAQLGNVRMPSGVQITGHDQVLATGASSGLHASYQSNTKQSVLQAYPQYSHHDGQALPHHRLYGDGYAMNATDLAESGSFYNAVLATGLGVGNTNVGSLVSAPSKMGHVPGLLSEQQDFLMSQCFQPERGLGYHGSDSLQSPSLSVLPQQQQQQQQQQGRSLVIPNQCDVKECPTNLLNAHLQTPLMSLPDQKTLGVLAGEQRQSKAQRDQLSFLPHVQTEQVCEAKGNQDMSRMEQYQKDLGKQLHLPSDGLKLGHICPLDSPADQQMELSEQTCQASSADTGQSEVVSNDESLAPRQANGVRSSIGIQEVKKQQWLLVFLRHVSRCTNSEQCAVPQCEVGCRFWKHITTCQGSQCSYPRCMPLKRLLKHHDICRNSKCVVCGPVRNYFSRRSRATRDQIGKGPNVLLSASLLRASAANEVESPPVKRLKVEVAVPNVSLASQQPQQSFSTVESEEQTSFQDTLSTPKDECAQSLPITKPLELQTSNRPGKNKIGLSSLKIDSPTGSSLSAGSHLQGHTKVRLLSNIKLESDCMKEDSALQVAGPANIQTSHDAAKHVTVVSTVTNLNSSLDIVKPAKMKIPGTSYLEIFTPQQIRDHISSLRKWIGQSKGKAERNQAMEHQMAAGACSACAVETLAFDPTPIFCTHCGCRIKRNSTYHTTGSGENSHNFCGPCYNAIRADTLETCGLKVQKSTLEKKKNDEQRIEAWVECDKCKKWQHQICVLFNARINKERSEYTCPECCVAEMERCERVPLPANSVLGTKDLPTTILSDHVEERLALRLEQERVERARALGKNPEEVPTAEGLVVRVVSSVEKKLEVKQRFLDMFQQEEYPKDFLYKSKMLLLFQKIEGVEVCLFGMYVQEFGAECPQPNRRHVYLSYLDSVKYFRPDVKTISGEALRTFVYHEILIAYLDYSKKRGFSSCYIWACPPLKGDDYILYCHPEIQKTPKTDKLREWYLSMIAKAKKENIVVANKNLYDYYFTSNCECKAKVTAARLPYFDGDYWPGAAEDILQQLQEQEEGVHSQRRGKAKKVAPKRSSKTSAHAELAGNESRDLQLMHKLGQSIVAMKEDFIMVHMHHACAHCHNFITSGHRWFCRHCAGNFQLCDCCYEEHQKLGEEERHPAGKKEWHPLVMEEVDEVPADTVDKDEIMESEFFDNRQAFLNLCQGNQYQYDTLRRAKHSSMMVLYHLHNPNAPAFITSCSICHTEIEMGQGWKCKSCSDYDVCNSCFSSQDVQRHPHKLVARPAAADQSAANKDARQQRMLQLRTMLELLVHASQCRQQSCQYGKCKNMKDLFRHGISCTKRITGGCSLCKRMWFLLTSHARSCKETRCIVPRCMDLREHARRMQLQQESRRRAAVNEMIRQRAAEAAGAS